MNNIIHENVTSLMKINWISSSRIDLRWHGILSFIIEAYFFKNTFAWNVANDSLLFTKYYNSTKTNSELRPKNKFKLTMYRLIYAPVALKYQLKGREIHTIHHYA